MNNRFQHHRFSRIRIRDQLLDQTSVAGVLEEAETMEVTRTGKLKKLSCRQNLDLQQQLQSGLAFAIRDLAMNSLQDQHLVWTWTFISGRQTSAACRRV